MKAVIVIAIVAVLMLLGAGVGYWYFFSTNTQTSFGQEHITETSHSESLDPLHVPEGWEVYTNEDAFGVSFAYPAYWKLTERTRSTSEEVVVIILEGDGYVMAFRNTGSGLPHREWTHPDYYVDGVRMSTWEYTEDENHVLVLSTKNTPIQSTVVIFITTPTSNREVADEILSTLNFKDSS